MGKVVIMGAGESGVGAAILARTLGEEVWVSDAGLIGDKYKKILEEHEVPFEEGKHSIEKFFDADVIVKSPGIPGKVPVLQQLREAGRPVISEIEYAFRYTDAKIIAITGSNGKTTTTSLIYHLMKEAGEDVGLGGNIGKSFALQVATEKKAVYVLEVSSFQLDDIELFRPEVAVLLNITPDHLDRYDYSMDKYARAKMRITENQTMQDTFIYCLDDDQTMRMMAGSKTKARRLGFSFAKEADGYVSGNSLVAGGETVIDFREMKLLGLHNQLNTLAALLAVQAYGLKLSRVSEALKSFQPIEHRLELVAEIDGIRYINDSKATNVDAVYFALEGLKGPIVWLAGGVDKGNEYGHLIPLVKEKVKAIVVLGKDDGKFRSSFDVPQTTVMSMDEALQAAQKFSQSGDTVLLSPACASFDLFKNYEDRGRQFKEAISMIIKEE